MRKSDRMLLKRISDSTRKSGNTSRQMTMKTQSIIKPMGGSKSSFKSEVHSDTGLPQETRHVSNT